ncbi:MAG: hypothetical protein QOJ03_1885 [Frankiaceae bacterium]|nr:hypothetical protein [Frankiaceae bacterium]
MRQRIVMAAAALTLAMSTVVTASAAPKPASGEPNPIVEGPVAGGVHGYMWNHSLFDLDNFDYTENEYFFSGVAASHQNGVETTAPYRSRFFVRLPRDASRFNGTVIVEWLNVTDQDDLETVWPVEADYLMQHGYGYVGVSAQLAGVCCGPTTLKGWDPVRYSTLVHPGDNFSYDIYTQAIQALRHPKGNRTYVGTPDPVDPMLGMNVKYVVANGASQSAGTLTTYINNHYNNHHLIDLYVITRGGGPFDDLSTPVFQLNEEAQPAHPKDNSHYVLWEEAGTAHAPAVWYGYVWREKSRDQAVPGAPNPINAACGLNRGSTDYSARALTYWGQQYLTKGTLPPSAPRLKRDSGGTVVRDKDSLAKGGLRHPFVQVPIALNRSETTDCPLFGLYRSWPAAKIVARYHTHAGYVAKVAAWAAVEVRHGWLLPQDRRDVVRKARAFDGPWKHASCYDTANATGNESGPVSSAVGDESFDPNLPLGAQSVARDVNCNVVVPLGL